MACSMSSASTTAIAFKALWAGLHVFQQGMSVASLNGIQAPLTCGLAGGPGPIPAPGPGGGHPAEPEGTLGFLGSGWQLTPCVPMTSTEFGLVVSITTLGGLAGALGTRTLIHRYGSIGALRWSAICVLLGSLMLALGNTISMLFCARIVIGLGCGISTTTVPLVLAEIAPPHIRRALGVMNQLAIVLGLLLGQSLSFPLGGEMIWRWVPMVAAAIAVVQLVGARFVSLPSDEELAINSAFQAAEGTPLLPSPTVPELHVMTLAELWRETDPAIVRGVNLVLLTQFCQQISGISAVMYFSTRIMTPLFPSSAKIIALAIVMWKAPVTLVPAFLIERYGSRPLLTVPTAVMAAAALFLGIGINSGAPAFAVTGIMVFVTFFSFGLGPVVWVVVAETLPMRARPAASAAGLAVNWATNFVVGAAFLPLQEWLAGDRGAKGEGTVFYFFAVACLLSAIAIRQGYNALERVQ